MIQELASGEFCLYSRKTACAPASAQPGHAAIWACARRVPQLKHEREVQYFKRND